jgi:hypothetical protein
MPFTCLLKDVLFVNTACIFKIMINTVFSTVITAGERQRI